MGEDVAASIVGLDETKPLGLVEPFHNASGHSMLLGERRGKRPRRATDDCMGVGRGMAGGKLRRRLRGASAIAVKA